jgi:hypothetical protein
MAQYPGGFWYQDNCLEITKYGAGKIRWQYPGEPWQEIEGNDYSLNQALGQCNTQYTVKGKSASNGLSYCGASWQTNPKPINNWTLYTNGRVKGLKRVTNVGGSTQPHQKYNKTSTGACGSAIPGATTRHWFAYLDWEGQTNINQGGLIYFDESWLGNFDNQPIDAEVVKILSIKRSDNQPDNCGDWTFTVLSNGQEIYKSVRPQKPTVEKIGCSKQIPIKVQIRTSPLGLVEVSKNFQNFSATTQYTSPNECIVVTNIIPYLPLGSTTGSLDKLTEHVGQYCSSKGCPEPETIFLADTTCSRFCESCPDDTCPIECGDHICCYNNYGISIKEIPIADYCGGTT